MLLISNVARLVPRFRAYIDFGGPVAENTRSTSRIATIANLDCFSNGAPVRGWRSEPACVKKQTESHRGTSTKLTSADTSVFDVHV